MTRLGTRSGDNVAVIGEGAWDAAWARLAGVRIVAEVPPEEENRFLAVGEATRDQVFDALSKAGVSAIVTDYMPACAVTGWNKLGKTQYCARLLAR